MHSTTQATIRTEKVHGAAQVRVSVLAVHVVDAGARVVLDPEAKVLHVAGVLLRDLIHVQDLAGGLLHLTHLVHEVPEAGLGHDLVGSEQLHAVSGRVRVRSRGSLAANHLVQVHLQSNQQ